jgi:hypothetical protein
VGDFRPGLIGNGDSNLQHCPSFSLGSIHAEAAVEGLVSNDRLEPLRVAAIAGRLQAYIVRRPNAADSLRGLQDWWLGDFAPAPRHAEMVAAVGLLEQTGVLERMPLDDGTEIWRRARPG